MTKFEELERIQKLKDNGAITNVEFETEKQRILNNENIQNKTADKDKNNNGIKVKKKTIKIIVAIIATIAVVALGILLTQIITTEINIKQTESKLREIDAEELQIKLIEELDNTKLNININGSNVNNMYIITTFDEGVNFENYITAQIICWKNGKIVSGIEMPCFKIISDSNGKFKNIEYTEDFFGKYIIGDTVAKVFKDNYDIELTKSWGLFNFDGNFNGKYNKRFDSYSRNYKYTNKGKIYSGSDAFLKTILNEVFDRFYTDYGKISDFDTEYRTVTFGLDF